MARQYMKNDERRDQILDAACRLFAESGFDKVTTKALAKEAGCSEALLYRYFPSKDKIYDALFEEYVQAQKEQAVLELINDSALKTLQAVYESLTNQDFDRKTEKTVRPGLYLAVQNRPSCYDRVRQAVMDGNDIVMNSIVPVIDYGKSSGEITSKKDSVILGKLFWAICSGNVLQREFLGGNTNRHVLKFEDIISIFE